MKRRIPIALALALLIATTLPAAERQPPRTGTVRYVPAHDESRVPEQFRLPAATFDFVEQPLGHISDHLTTSLVRFPSPVETPHEANNTVHCEYYRPAGDGPFPGVIVLHILGGDFDLARLFCNALAHRGTAALFLKMPYYGERRDPSSPRRMISDDPRETVDGMTQAVLDIRRAAAWLAAREEVDANELGILGISLGGITGALAATAEPRLKHVCLLLAGGDLDRVAWETKELAPWRRAWEKEGGTRESFRQLMQTIDPAAHGANVRGRRILMLNACDDEVIPRACTESLWRSFGEPEIVWYSGGHYSCARHILDVLSRATRFFGKERGGANDE